MQTKSFSKLPDLIIFYRKQKKIKQGALASQCGLTQASLSYIENGHKTPSPETIRNIMNALGVQLLYTVIEAE